MKVSRVYIGADHAGYTAKSELAAFLREQGYEVTDLGTFSEEPFDYPDISREVGEKVVKNDNSRGILLCGSGVGVAIAANKVHGIRATLANSVELAKGAREHNDANVVTMGARMTEMSLIKEIAIAFLTTEASTEERHKRRVQKMKDMDH